MTPRITLAVARRVLLQIWHDPRTLVMLLVLPSVMLALLWWMFKDSGGIGFDSIGPSLLALIPVIVMFLVTSVTTLRERSSGTLERLLSMPMGKLDLLVGYAVAFGIMATLQSVLAVLASVYWFEMKVAGPIWMLLVVAVVVAVLGMAMGLFVSAFARTEFQAVQFMPALITPQFLLCGLFVPRDQLPKVLSWISDLLPLSYAVDATQSVTTHANGIASGVWWDLLILGAFILAFLAFGAATLRRRTA